MSALHSYMLKGSKSCITSMEQDAISCIHESNMNLMKWHQQYEERLVFDEILDSYSGNSLAGGMLGEMVTQPWNSTAGDLEANGWYSLVGQVCGSDSTGEIGQNGLFCYDKINANEKFDHIPNVDNTTERNGVEANYIASGISGYREADQEMLPECASSEDQASMIGAGRESYKRATVRKAPRSVRRKVSGEDECSQIINKTKSRSAKVAQKKASFKKECCGATSKDESKVTEVRQMDYIHVRARRGQATDSHSLAERVRREKISERMKCLQNLVPGCNKVTGKAGMLDEIINYVQALQRQVEFLSMKLTCVHPALDMGADNLYAKEGFPLSLCNSNIPYPFGDTSPNPNPPFPMKREIEDATNVNVVLRNTVHPTGSLPASYTDASGFNTLLHQAAPWETEIRSLYNVAFCPGRSTTFPHMFTGTMESGNVKMEN